MYIYHTLYQCYLISLLQYPFSKNSSLLPIQTSAIRYLLYSFTLFKAFYSEYSAIFFPLYSIYKLFPCCEYKTINT